MVASYTLFILLSFESITNGKQFRCDYTYFPEIRGWLKYHKMPANWYEARLRCHLEGGNLASPTNISMKNAMRIKMKEATDDKSLGVFTGIHAYFSQCDYNTIEGAPLWRIPHTWATDEPDNKKDTESCIAYYSDGDIADVFCHKPLPYICYKQDTNEMAITKCGTTDPDYIYYDRTGSCYKFHTVPRTWSRAYMVCAAEGGYLAIINSEAEAGIIREIFATHPAKSIVGNIEKDVAFVGFYDWNEHGEWLTIHGETLSEAGYAEFWQGEPNNASTGEFCGAVYRTALLIDFWCDSPSCFVCEKSPDSLLCDSSTNIP